MPTNHRRISVTEDPELRSALREVQAVLGDEASDARLVRDLALQGARVILAERRSREESVERLIAWSTSGEDAQTLLEAREQAWR